MKVAIVCIAPLRDEGTVGGTYSAVLGEGLQADGVEVELWSRVYDRPHAPVGAPVLQIWRPGLFAWWDIVRAVRARKPDLVHFQHYFFVLGNSAAGEISTIALMVALAFMRVRVVCTLHDVPAREQITPAYVRMHSYRYPAWFIRAALGWTFRIVAGLSRKAIVHQAVFVDRLTDLGVARAKIDVIGHMALPSQPVERSAARAALGLPADGRIVLFFGYATGYKGIEDLLAGFALLAERGRPFLLVLGAGIHPKIFGDPEYRAFYERLRATAEALPNVAFAGFIDTDRLDAYISAADAGILPYVEYHGASGPMYFYLSHRRPVLVSRQIADHTAELSAGAFETTPEGIADAVERFFDDPSVGAAIAEESELLRESVFANEYVGLTRTAYEQALG